MKDIDELLRIGVAAKPRRPLGAHFTNIVINRVTAGPIKTSWFAVIKDYVMKLLHKPILTAIMAVAVIAVSGTAYAAIAGWPGVTALFGGQKNLPTGERVVKVETTNCTFITALNVTQKRQPDQAHYYKISKDSKLTNQQVTQMVQGHCELEAQTAFATKIQKELEKTPANTGRMHGGYVDSVIKEISASSVTLEADMPIFDANNSQRIEKITRTFPIASDAVAYDHQNQISISALKPGDHVGTVYRADDTALQNTETPPWLLNTSEQPIVHFIKNTPNISASLDYQKYNRSEFEEVTPCEKTTSGYCTAEEFYTL